jgi:hypothetical protein
MTSQWNSQCKKHTKIATAVATGKKVMRFSQYVHIINYVFSI